MDRSVGSRKKLDPTYLPCTSSQTAGGESGNSCGCTPNEESALATALAITPPTGMMPPSPAPLAPSGLIGEG